jgi:quaternary ammonium compound-resistance protein SugE
MSWLILFFAGALEVVWALCLKLSTDAYRPSIVVLFVVSLIASMWLLAVAMREIPLGTAYAVWTGIGAIGSMIVGIVFFNEPLALARISGVLLIAAGLLLIK